VVVARYAIVEGLSLRYALSGKPSIPSGYPGVAVRISGVGAS
jgi:hypothetical protein